MKLQNISFIHFKSVSKQMSQGKEAYEEARQRDFERKIAEDYKNPRKMTFTEMVNRYL